LPLIRRATISSPTLSQSGVITESVPKRTLSGTEERRAQISQAETLCLSRVRQPDVVAIKADVVPAERSDVSQQLVGQGFVFGREARPRRQYRYSASRLLRYWVKGAMSPTKSASVTVVRTLFALPRHASAGSYLSPLAYDLEQILR
jgi:hypothetical protein